MRHWKPAYRLARILALALLGGPACRIQSLPPANTGPGNPSGDSSGDTAGDHLGGTVSAGDNTPYEQLQMERINRARLRPEAEAARFNISLNEGLAPGTISSASKQALAFNAILTGTARAHASDMLARDFFEHVNPDGRSPFDRMTTAGYIFQTAGENLAWRGTTGTLNELATVEGQHQDLFVDRDIDGRGHRVVMLNENFREVGIGVVRGQFTQNARTYDSMMLVQDFGARFGSPTFVTGVVYDDANHNGDYDAGEGRANQPVILGSLVTATNGGGGYAFPVEQTGAYALQFSTGGAVNLTVGRKNIKVDLVNSTQVVVNLGLGPLP